MAKRPNRKPLPCPAGKRIANPANRVEQLINDLHDDAYAVNTHLGPLLDAHEPGHYHCAVKYIAKNLGGGIELCVRPVGESRDIAACRCKVHEIDGLDEQEMKQLGKHLKSLKRPGNHQYGAMVARYISGGKPPPSDPPVGEWQPRKAGRNG